ncbi:PTS system beta-glucosides-specific IIC component [Arthrobacter bambusae]|uniref:PTS system beta-glucosides-specific IIC component n=1 Tax=Arthrobacter bambusae TaxID=1338426 RepID=A0ABV2P130_9MICC
MKSSTTTIAAQILEDVGGAQNVSQLTHCATRLRFELHNPQKANIGALEQIPEVLRAQHSGGQTQVVVGGKVDAYYRDINEVLQRTNSSTDQSSKTQIGSSRSKRPNVVSRFIALIASVFTPILPALIAAGMVRAGVTVLQSAGIIATDTTLFAILSAVGDSVFYFLPVLLASSAAKKFDANPYLAMLLAAVLLHPTWVTLVRDAKEAGETIATVLGLPILLVTYSSTVIPIILAVWVLKHVTDLLTKIIPESIRIVFVPAIALMVMIPLLFVIIGPLGHYVGQLIADGVGWLFTSAGWLAQTVLSGVRPILVIFGLHYSFVPIQVQEVAATGATALLVGAFAANLAQAGSGLALALLVRGNERSGAAAAASTALFGITEPIIYGYNLRYKFPFFVSCVAAAAVGLVLGLLNTVATAVALPGILSTGILHGDADLVVTVAVLLGGTVLAFALTLAYGKTFGRAALERTFTETGAGVFEPTQAPEMNSPTAALQRAAGTVLSPMAGDAVPLTEVPDKLFSGGVLGNGVAILPRDGVVVSPVTGEVVMVAKTRHAVGIRTKDGLELLIHVGIDTVKMNGAPFTVLVEQGQTVSAGQRLLNVDLGLIEEAGFSTVTPIVVVKPAKAPVTEEVRGNVTTGTVLFQVGSTSA